MVYYEKESGRWRAKIRINGRTTHIGRFDRKLDAEIAYECVKKIIESRYGMTSSGLNELNNFIIRTFLF